MTEIISEDILSPYEQQIATIAADIDDSMVDPDGVYYNMSNPLGKTFDTGPAVLVNNDTSLVDQVITCKYLDGNPDYVSKRYLVIVPPSDLTVLEGWYYDKNTGTFSEEAPVGQQDAES